MEPTTGAAQTVSQSNTEGDRSVRIELDESKIQPVYANLFVVSSTPEEVIIDVALDTGRQNNQPVRRIPVGQRVVLSPFTAKRLVATLSATLQRYEQTFGRLEVDVRKRVVEPTQFSAQSAGSPQDK